jgi:Replication initiation factor
MTAGNGSECESPQVVKRGLHSHKRNDDVLLEVGVHWLRGSVPHRRVDEITPFLEQLFGDEWQPFEYGLWTYDRSLLWPNGVRVNCHSTEERADRVTKGKATLEIPGSALDALGTEGIAVLMKGLLQYDFSPSRLDLYFDDRERIISPQVLYHTVCSVTPAGKQIRKDYSGFKRIDARGPSDGTKRVYDECAFGRRGSKGGGKYLRIYDKALESQGENPSIRWELELCDKRAKMAYECLVLCASQDADWEKIFAQAIGAFIGGCIDFKRRDGRAGSKNLSRCERYPFWQAILQKLDAAELRIEQPQKTIEKAKRYVETQVAGTLQMLAKAMGKHWLSVFLIDIVGGDEKLGPKHWAAIRDYEQQHKERDTRGIKDLRRHCDRKGIAIEDAALPENVTTEPATAQQGGQ